MTIFRIGLVAWAIAVSLVFALAFLYVAVAEVIARIRYRNR
jgi:hypothetical protein